MALSRCINIFLPGVESLNGVMGLGILGYARSETLHYTPLYRRSVHIFAQHGL